MPNKPHSLLPNTHSPLKQPKVALVHDWLTGPGGAEKVLLNLHQMYPDAPIYTSVYNAEKAWPEFKKLDIRTTWLQKIPLAKTKHQLFPMLRPLAFRSLDLHEYDIVISITTSDAKAVRTNKNQLHICYCNTPTRYYWSHYEQYKREPGFGWLNPLVRLFIPLFVRIMRRVDLRAAAGVDVFIGNSSAVSERIQKYYHRESYTLFPPVETNRFTLPSEEKRQGLLVTGRQVPYKRIDLAIEAANKLGLPLHILGSGSEHDQLVKIAGPTVTFQTKASNQEMVAAYQSAELYLYPGEEDAGIVPLEAMACGTPIVGFKKGGIIDSVIDGQTGVLFDRQTVSSLCEAIVRARTISFDRLLISKHVLQFSETKFRQHLADIVKKEWESFNSENGL